VIGESIPFGIWICDAQGALTYCSKAILDLLGMTFEEVAGAGWFATLHPDDVEQTERAWTACVSTGSDWVRLHRYRDRKGGYHPVLARGRAIRNADGTIREWVGINFDVAGLIEAHRALAAED
jgi:PAS domain S-box-containing protein